MQLIFLEIYHDSTVQNIFQVLQTYVATRQTKTVSMSIIETQYQRIIVPDVSERSYGIGLLCTSQNSVVEKK